MTTRAVTLFETSIGKKAVMAVSGVVWFGYLVGHMAGNLQVFVGREKINDYSAAIHHTLWLLWGTRVLLLVSIVAHIWAAYQLADRSWKARPVAYARHRYTAADYASRTMRWSGPIIFLYVIYHLMHLTLGVAPGVPYDAHDVYGNLVRGFQNPLLAGTYILAMTLLSFHLYHGLWSLFQSLGLESSEIRCAAPTVLRSDDGDHLLWLHLGTSRRAFGSGAIMEQVAKVSGDPRLQSKAPEGDIASSWERHKFALKLVNPANKRKYNVIVVGSGLAGGAGAASLGELGYNVKCFCFQDSPRRAHSIAAQGGINAAKNYQNDGDSVYRLFYDTVKGGDFRSREQNVYRLAQLSVQIIDQCVAQGVPFAREYSGLLANRSFGGAQVSRTFYARGQTGQQLLLGAYSALEKQIDTGTVKMFPRTEMLDLIVIDGRARGIVARDLTTGEITSHLADAVILATGGYGNVFYLSTNAKGSNATAIWRAHRRGAYFANPCFTQIHPTCIPVSGDYQSKLTLMSESLRNDGRVWVPLKKEDLAKKPADIPEADRDYYLERRYRRASGNLGANAALTELPRRAPPESEFVSEGRGVGPGGRGVYLDFAGAIKRLGESMVAERYGNLFEMYERITGDNPYKTPMRIYPAIHYTMGGLWVDYNLQSTVPGLFVAGEANFSDHGANRLGASALMQGLADGYFVLPYTIGDYLAQHKAEVPDANHPEVKAVEQAVKDRVQKFLSIKGKRTPDSFHRELGLLCWEYCGMARNEKGLTLAIEKIRALREEFWRDVNVYADTDLNQSLEKAGRVADFLELGELMCRDALERRESCGGHFREEMQTPEGEALRDDDKFRYAAAWEFAGEGKPETLHQEHLEFDNVHLAQRSYK